MNWWALSFSILFIILILFVSITMYWTVKWPNWKTAPAQGLSDVIKELGPPSTANYGSKGMAVWDSKRLDGEPWKRLIIRDEEIPNCCPTPSKDFLYVSLCLDLDNALVESMVLSVNEGIWYDSGKNRLWIRSDSLRSAVATALFVTMSLLDISASDSFSDIYDSFWQNYDQIQSDYAKLVKTVQESTDDDYQNYKTALQAALDELGCPSLSDCDDADCGDNPWSPDAFQGALTSTGVKSIPPNTTENFSSRSNGTANKYSLGPRKNSRAVLNRLRENPQLQSQPYTLGYPVDPDLPKNWLNETRERYQPRNTKDSRGMVGGEMVGISRNKFFGGLDNHSQQADREYWTESQCKTCNVKRNGRPMTIPAV